MNLMVLSLLTPLIGAGPDSVPKPPLLGCQGLPALLNNFETVHYAKDEVSGKVQSRSIEQFIKALDPTKTLLLKSDVDRLRARLPQLFRMMEEGNCALLGEAAKVVLKRVEADLEIAKSMLGPKYKVDESVELQLDPDKRGYAANEEARANTVRKYVHFQMSNTLMSGMTMKKAKKRVIHRYELAVRRQQERRADEELPGLYASAFARSLDPHSSFFSARELADFEINMRLSLEGIGAVLRSEDGFTVIQSLVPGGQADKQNILRPKDKITAVAQTGDEPVDVIDMDLRDVVSMIRGKKGTEVTLSILREDPEPKTFDVTIVRDKIDVKGQAAKISYQTKKVKGRKIKVAILELPSFYGSEGGRTSFGDMKRLLAEAKSKKAHALVLDLSKNGGGLLAEAVRISGLFLKEGAIVATRSSDGDVEVLADEDDSTQYNGPMVVLTSPASASASEILAGALQDYRRAIIVGGEHTFGKGTVQQLRGLPLGLGAVKVTMGMFFRPSGSSTQQQGVRSDIRIPSLLDGAEIGEKELDYSLPPQSTPPFLSGNVNDSSAGSKWTPVLSGMIRKLASKSQGRVAKSKVFKEIRKDLAEDKQRDVVKLSELRKKKSKNGNDGEAAKAKYKAKEEAVVSEAAAIAADLAATLSR